MNASLTAEAVAATGALKSNATTAAGIASEHDGSGNPPTGDDDAHVHAASSANDSEPDVNEAQESTEYTPES